MRTIEEIIHEMTEVLGGADTEERSLTDTEVETYEGLEVELTSAREQNELRSRHQAYLTPVGGPRQIATGVQDDDDTLNRAFDHYLRTGQENQDLVELRAQSVGTDAAGGFTVPEGFRQKLVDRMVAFGGLANEVEVISTATGNRLPWPTIDDTANVGEIAAEGAAGAAGNDMVFGELELGAFKYTAPGGDNSGADPLRVSVELLQDSAFDVEGLITRKLATRIARTQAVDWVQGAGTTEPQGITDAGLAAPDFAGAAPTKDELLVALHTVDPAYRPGAVWAFNDATLLLIRQIEDSTGRPLLMPSADSSLAGLPGGVLLGHRVAIDQAFADYTDATTNVWGVFGDLAEGYVIRRVSEINIVVDPYTRAHFGQRTYSIWTRADGAIQNPNAYALLSNDG